MSDLRPIRIDDLSDAELEALLASPDGGASLEPFDEHDEDGEMSLRMARYLTAQHDMFAKKDPEGEDRWRAEALAAFPDEEEDE
jgi:hypothetical protein